MTRINRAAALMISILAGACSKAESSPEQAAAQAPSTEKKAPAAGRRIADVCALVTQSEAESILGMKLEPPQRQSGGDCWYLRQGGKDFGAVELILSILPVWVRSEKEFDELVTSQTNDMNANLKSAGVAVAAFTLEKAEGVGAPAYFIDPGLYVMKGQRVLAVALGGEKGIAIAKVAISRMP